MGRFDGKTEKATPQKRQKARREGTVARSQEVGVAASLLAMTLTIRAFGPAGVEALTSETRTLLSTAGPELAYAQVGSSAGRMMLLLLGPVVGAATIAALVAGFGQVGFRLTPKTIQPKITNLSPKKGLQRLAPAKAGWELVRTAAKLGLLVAVVWAPLRNWIDNPQARSLDDGLGDVLAQSWTLLMSVTALATVIAAADYIYNRRRTEKELRMSKDDVKREYKDSEGDPLVRSHRRRRAQELSRNRMLSDVATADVVVTNPTHFAVALRYADGEAAPRVVAKGTNLMAKKIRELAYRHGVVVTENKPLARALYRRCKIGQYVPAALYEAVAVVLALAYRRRGLMPVEQGSIA